MKDYEVQEEMMMAARKKGTLQYEGADIKLLQDLSRTILQRWRQLKPLLLEIQVKGWPYRWGFGAIVRSNRQEDIESFCRDLEIARPQIPGWDPPPAIPQEYLPWQMVTDKHSAKHPTVNISLREEFETKVQG